MLAASDSEVRCHRAIKHQVDALRQLKEIFVLVCHNLSLSLSLSLCVCVCTYIYTYTSSNTMKNQANTKQKIEMQEEKMIKERDIAALAA